MLFIMLGIRTRRNAIIRPHSTLRLKMCITDSPWATMGAEHFQLHRRCVMEHEVPLCSSKRDRMRNSKPRSLSMSLSKASEPFEKALQGQDVCNDIFEPAWIPSLGRCSGQGFRRELCQLGMLCTIRAIHDTRHGLKLDIDAARE